MLRKIIVSLACVVSSAPAWADSSLIDAANNQMGIQTISTYVNYTETGFGRLGTRTGTLDTETGPVPGVAVYLSTMSDWLFGNDYLEIEYAHSSGNTDYVGAYQGGIYGSVTQTSSAIFSDYSGRYGRGFKLGSASLWTPYLEWGQHTWERGVNYGETYTHRYSGIGLLQQYGLGRHVVLALNVLYGGTADSFIVVNSGANLTGFNAPLGNSTFSKAGISFDYAFSHGLHASLGVDYLAFEYGISATYSIGGGFVAWEPDSSSKYTIARFGLSQSF